MNTDTTFEHDDHFDLWEHELSDPPSSPARGVLISVVVGAAMWALIIYTAGRLT